MPNDKLAPSFRFLQSLCRRSSEGAFVYENGSTNPGTYINDSIQNSSCWACQLPVDVSARNWVVRFYNRGMFWPDFVCITCHGCLRWVYQHQGVLHDIDYGLFSWPLNEILKAKGLQERDKPLYEVQRTFYYKEKPIVASKKRMARKAKRTLSLRFQIFKRDNYRCRLCGAAARDGEHVRLEIDHITPKSKGGTDDMSNLWVLCFRCNRGKGARNL